MRLNGVFHKLLLGGGGLVLACMLVLAHSHHFKCASAVWGSAVPGDGPKTGRGPSTVLGASAVWGSRSNGEVNRHESV